MSASSAIARRTLHDARVRTIAFAYLFAGVAYANAVGYHAAYPTLAGRLALARTFGDNVAVRLFYGRPFDLLSAGGYAAWRIGGLLSIFAGAWGVVAAVQALRGEADAGRTELVLASPVSRSELFGAVLVAIGAGTALIWLTTFAGLLAGGLAVGGSAYLALAIVAVAPVYVGVGALASQLASTRGFALRLSGGVLALTLLMRMVADTAAPLSWLRWATPLGWVEELRPFTGARPVVLLALVAAAAVLLGLAHRLMLRHDVGTGLIAERQSTPPRLALLGTPVAQALRGELSALIVWILGIAVFALVIGTVSTTIASAGLSSSVRRQLHKLAPVTITTPAGYVGLTFLFFALAISLFACSQLAAARREESEQRLETLLSMPVSHRGWLSGRLLLAAAAAAAIALVAGAATWVGAATQHAGITLPRMLLAGVNWLPVAMLFLSLGALAFAVVPRAGVGLAYGIVALAFVWDLFGGLLGAPRWLLDLTPFEHVGLVPAQPFRATAAIVLLAVAAAFALAAVELFARRDVGGN